MIWKDIDSFFVARSVSEGDKNIDINDKTAAKAAVLSLIVIDAGRGRSG